MGKNQHVVPHESGWAVRGDGNRRATSVHRTKSEAVKAARRIAAGQRASVIVHKDDGGPIAVRDLDDPVIELLRTRERDVPPSVREEMLARLKSGLDENRMSPRKLFP